MTHNHQMTSEPVKYRAGDIVVYFQPNLGDSVPQTARVGIVSPDSSQLYLRFVGRDKRNDAWVPAAHVEHASAEEKKRVHDEEASGHGGGHGRPSTGSLRITDTKNVQEIIMGTSKLSPWYFSPFPDEYATYSRLYMCPRCLNYTPSAASYQLHLSSCAVAHPPGDMVWVQSFDDVQMAFFEVDGRIQKVYCQNLCLLSRLFLEHKTLHYDVEPFFFYILTKKTEDGYEILGYFSKEKQSYNTLACILTLPQHQQKGYARLLMDMAYALCRREGRYGGPEEPLSDLGKVSFEAYWTEEVCRALYLAGPLARLTPRELMVRTGLKLDHVRLALVKSKLLVHHPVRGFGIKCWDSDSKKLLEQKYRKAINRPRVDDNYIMYTPLPSMMVTEDK